MRALAVEVSPFDPGDAAHVALRFADRDDARATILNGERCWPGILRNIVLNREGWNGDWTGSVAVPQASFDVSLLALRKADALSPRYRWTGARVRIYSGPVGDPSPLFDGMVTVSEIDDGVLRITARIDDEAFAGDALPEKYDGQGDLGGDEGLAEIPKPMCFGFCRNVPPLMINEAHSIFQVHGYGPIKNVVALFERGIDFGEDVGDYPTYDALFAATVPEGRWATCLAQGLIRLGAPPAGAITCDVEGDNTGGFHQTTTAIIRRLCEISSVPGGKLDAASLDAFEAAVPFPVNLYVQQQDSLLGLIVRLALPCNAQVSFSWRGKLQVSRFAEIPAPALELNAQGETRPAVIDARELGISAPVWRLEMQYGRSWRVQTKDELVLAEERPEPMPVTIWRRYPTQPPTPEGNGVPEGWSRLRADYAVPTVDLGWEGGDVFGAGPLWRSGALQREGETTEDGWTVPVLDDLLYRGFTFATDNERSHVLMSSSGLKAAPTLSWHPGWSDEPALAVIPEYLDGPFNLSWRVRKGTSMFVGGIMNYDPRAIMGNGSLSLDDIFAGAFVLNNNDLTISGDADEPLTGVWGLSQWDYSNNYVSNLIGQIDGSLPPDQSLYQLTFNGEIIDLYVNGIHARSWVHVKETWGTEGFWPVFALLDHTTEIYDVHWEPGERGRRSQTRMQYVEGGAARYRQHLHQWEVFGPYVNEPGFGYAFGETIALKGDVRLSFEINVPASDGPTPGYTQFAFLGNQSSSSGDLGFRFRGNGMFGLIGPGETVDRPYAEGDAFSVEVESRIVRYFHNGQLLSRNRVTPGRTYRGFWELGGAGWIRRFVVGRSGDDTLTPRVVVQAPTWENVVTPSDLTVNVGGTMMAEIARTPALGFTVPPHTDAGGTGTTSDGGVVRVAASLAFRATVGAVRPLFQLQVSTNGGASFSNVTTSGALLSDDGSNGPADVLKQSVSHLTLGLSGTHSRIYRLLAYNVITAADWEMAIDTFAMEAEFEG